MLFKKTVGRGAVSLLSALLRHLIDKMKRRIVKFGSHQIKVVFGMDYGMMKVINIYRRKSCREGGTLGSILGKFYLSHKQQLYFAKNFSFSYPF